MKQFQENAWTEGQAEGRKTLFYRTIPATAGGPKRSHSLLKVHTPLKKV